ncbi:hypothetical protein TCON_0213 [Astathelohania contejeani]|uniref:RING-type domain-containing protein n=1 Tax=Astathelohania contejeani TaxID=164912 RepID=A0ABQ7I2F1_9MICR|nr:hypothetical protein TCON_0213 [Thelohania contejeani]
MNEKTALSLLIYCNRCHKSSMDSEQDRINIKKDVSKDPLFFTGECMHIICYNCVEEWDICRVCCKRVELVPIDDKFKENIVNNPTESFAKPLETMMFQLSSAINLILYLRNETRSYKNMLKRAKTELDRIRQIYKTQNTNEQPIFNFKEAITKTNINKNIQIENNSKNSSLAKNSIYRPGRRIEPNKAISRFRNMVSNDSNKSTSKSNNKKKSTTVIDLRRDSKRKKNEYSVSSSISSRLTLSKRKF